MNGDYHYVPKNNPPGSETRSHGVTGATGAAQPAA